VLLAGGLDDTQGCCGPIPPQASMHRYVPGVGFTGAGSMIASRYNHTASMLANGKVLFAGTWGWGSVGGRSAELYDPTTAFSLVNVVATIGNAGSPYQGFTLLPQGGSGGPYAINLVSGTLPAGMSYDSDTHAFSGTPTQSGTVTMGFTVTDGSSHSNTQ